MVLKAKARAKTTTSLQEPTPTFAQEQNRGAGRLVLSAFVVISLLCGLDGLYNHFADLRYFQPGVHHFNQHQYPAAERDFRSYLHLNNDPDGHYFLGRTLLAEGKLSAARAEFLKDGTLIASKGRAIWTANDRSAPFLRQLPK